MKKFDLKKAILENKATFHSSLNEEVRKTKMYFHVLEDGGYGNIGHQGVYDTEKEAQSRANELADMFPNSFFYVEASDSENEPYSVTMEEGYDEFKRVEKGSKGVTAKDKGEEEVYGAGVKKGEEIEKKKLKENSNKPTTVPELIFQIQKKYPRMNWLESELPNNPTFQDVKGTLEDNGYGKIYNEFMGGDIADGITDLNETNTKMKKSDLKAKIKEMIVAEYEKDVDVTDENPEKEEDFLSEIAAMLDESPMNDPRLKQVIQMLIDMDVDGETMEYILRQVGMDDQMANQLVNYPAEYTASLKEADETEKDTAEVDTTDVAVDDTETVTTSTEVEVDPNVKAVQDALTQAQVAAQKLGDKKLTDQIGNTITFFTREHVVEKPKTAVAESMFPMLNKILK